VIVGGVCKGVITAAGTIRAERALELNNRVAALQTAFVETGDKLRRL
jgi:hypothetical protein